MENAQMRQQAADTAELLYYNQVLYQKGIISENERNQMIALIENRKSSPPSHAAVRSPTS